MTIIVAQQNITQSLTLNQAQLLNLLSRYVLAPGIPNFINVFLGATINSRFSVTPFDNANNVLTFKVGSIIVSNSLNAQNILELTQNTSATFIPANPYSSLMSVAAGEDLTFGIDTSNITGGSAGSSLTITFKYSVFQLA